MVQQRQFPGAGVSVLLVLLTFWAGRPAAQAPAAAAGRGRWQASERLNEDELRRFLAETAEAVEGRGLSVRDGDAVLTVDSQGRDMLLVILSGALPVQDLGLKDGAGGRLRGVRASATPPRSEVGAKQTLWIDVDSGLPARFEFTYEVPGLGDLAYDLLFD